MLDNQQHVSFTDNLTIKFEGDNTIDFQQLFGYLAGIEAAYQASLDAEYHSPSMKLKVVAINEGSFEIILQSAVALVPDLIKTIPTVVTTFKNLMEMISIKRELNGQKPQSIEKDGCTTKIVNADGDIHYHNCTVANYYFNNPSIDAGISRAFSALNLGEESREAVCLSSNQETIRIGKEKYPSISATIVTEPDNEKLKDTSIEYTYLKVAKLDFIGDTMWSFVDLNNRTLKAYIEDDKFLKDVRLGKIKLSANMILHTKLRIEVEKNEYSDIIHRKIVVEEVLDTKEIPQQEQTSINYIDPNSKD